MGTQQALQGRNSLRTLNTTTTIKRTKTIKFRVSEAEHATITAKAKAVGSVATLLRDQGNRITIRSRKNEAELIRILRRFDGHFRVLCHWCDANARPEAAIEIIALLITLDREISRLGKTIEEI